VGSAARSGAKGIAVLLCFRKLVEMTAYGKLLRETSFPQSLDNSCGVTHITTRLLLLEKALRAYIYIEKEIYLNSRTSN